MSDTIREPKQKRSIDTKNRIIESGYEMFAKNGYFNTNTAEIAKHAGVSTGIVYGYFHDKKDILIEVLDIYVAKVFAPFFEMLQSLSAPLDFDDLIPKIIDSTVNLHQNNAAIHEALHSLSASDADVNDRFMQLEEETTRRIVEKVTALGFPKENCFEKIHIVMEFIQSYAHEYVYDNHSYIDYQVMRNQIIKMLVELLKG